MDKATRQAKKFVRIAKANGLKASVKILAGGRSFAVIEKDDAFTEEKLQRTRLEAEAKLCTPYWHLKGARKR